MALLALSVHRGRPSLKIYTFAFALCVTATILKHTEGASSKVSWGDWSAWSACCGSLHTNRTVRIRYPATRNGVPFQCDIDDTQRIQISECVCELNNTKTEDGTPSADGSQLSVKEKGRPEKEHPSLIDHIQRSKRSLPGYGNYGFDNYNYQGRASSHRGSTFSGDRHVQPPEYQYNAYHYNTYGQTDDYTHHGEDFPLTAGQYDNANLNSYNFDYGDQEYQYDENVDTNQMAYNYYHQYTNGRRNHDDLIGYGAARPHFFGARTETKWYGRHPQQNAYDEYYDQYVQNAEDGATFGTYDKELEVLPPRTVQRLQSSQEQILDEIRTLNLRLEESKDVVAQFTNEITHLEERALANSRRRF